MDVEFPDSIVETWQDPNSYLFVNNNPLYWIDFLGLALSDSQIANIIFNETRSLSGGDLDRCRCNLAHAIKNGDKQEDEGKIKKRPKTAPATAKVPDGEKGAYQSCVDAVKKCNDEKKKGTDPTKGGIHFNLRGNSGRGPFQGHPLTSQCGPFNNSYKKGGLPPTGVYVNTYE
ncbi:MAG: hypothetical protein FJ405_07240 [Verrucomicrobia bacterium]|nr:hypothetical protein [Verrucomicrobiota bacterium]